MSFRLNPKDISAFRCLTYLSVLYGTLSILAFFIVNMKHVKPLDMHAPLYRFSEARSVEHVRILSNEIDGRQEGRAGLEEAAYYIKTQLDSFAERAGPKIKFEIDETLISGHFNLMFLRRGISLGYRNHTNIIARISSIDSKDTDPSVLVNGHFDAPLGSPGAGDCASCVASMLEIVRLIVDSNWIPPRPVIFLFNGAEELFLLGAHAFATTHKWYDSVGAFINVEASGTGGFDLVCQSGPGSWPSAVYAQSAVYPMAHSIAQDIFPLIPGDTDYRIFAEDYGAIPGLDIIFVLGGYFYHTSYDTWDRLLPGSMQARGDNLFSMINAFASSSKLQRVNQNISFSTAPNRTNDDRYIFFDYLTWFMVFYSKRVAIVLHSFPIGFFLLVPFFLEYPNVGINSWFTTFSDFLKGMLSYCVGVLMAIICPVLLAILRLLFSNVAMNWFDHPYLALLMFLPCSVVGLLIPTIVEENVSVSKDVSLQDTSKEKLSEEARFWGVFGFYATITLVYLVAGLSGGFLTLFLAIFMIPAWIAYRLLTKYVGQNSLSAIVGYTVPLLPCIIYSVFFSGFLVQFVIEKTGMMGSLPQPYGRFVPDVIVAAVIGIVTGWCMGPLLPIVSRRLGRPSIVKFLMQICVIALALSPQFFPYSDAAPKRVVFQHKILSNGDSVLNSSYDFTVVDANSLRFLFKYSPEAAKELELSINDESFIGRIRHYDKTAWMALFPVSSLISESWSFPASKNDISYYRHLPSVSTYKASVVSNTGSRRVFVELSLGSLEEVWVTVLNITGPLSNWSFADHKLPVPERENGGPLSYICRLSGSSHENWTFWLEANNTWEALRVDVVVIDQHLLDGSKKLKGLFPSWVDIIAYSSFTSTYLL